MISSFRKFLTTYKRILGIAYKVSPGLLILVTLLNSFWGLTNLPVLYINKLLIDLVISAVGKPDWQVIARTIVWVIFLRSTIEFTRFFINRLNRPMTQTLIKQISARVEIMLGEKLNSLDVPTVESPELQDKFKKIDREYNNRVWGMVSPLSEFPNAFFTIVSAAIPLFTFNPLVGFLVLFIRIPEVLVNAKFSRLEYQLSEKQSTTYRIWGWINYYLTNSQQFYENKILGISRHLTQKMEQIQKDVLQANYHLGIRRAHWRNLAELPDFILSIVLNSYFFILALAGRISLGTAQMLYQASNTLGGGFSMLLNNITTVYEHYLFMEDFSWFMDLKSQHADGIRVPQTPFRQGVEFKDVWFKYPSGSSWVLNGVSFSVAPRDNVAIVGENGAGKTTLIKLLIGFYKPQKGKIFVNGVDISNYDSRKYWNTIAVLFQDFADYAFSARESIGFGDVSRVNRLTEIRNAAKLTGIDGFIQRLPLKYGTPLTKSFEKGADPSKGQWQRIALARTLFRKAQMILLDEPTSNVDPKAEEEIFDKIIELTQKQILILISHRFSTVRRADKILLLEGGQITEQGTHDQLMELDKKYAHLFRLQAKSYQ